MRLSTLVVAGLAALLAGCGGGILGSCADPQGAAPQCTEYELSPSTPEQLEVVCKATQGRTWSTSPCASAARVGRCRVALSLLGVESRVVYHFYVPFTAEAAGAACDWEKKIPGQTADFIP